MRAPRTDKPEIRTRILPRLNEEETRQCQAHEAHNRSLKEYQNTTWSGKAVLDSTSIKSQLRLSKAIRLLMYDDSLVGPFVDIGAGRGDVCFFPLEKNVSTVALEVDELLNSSMKRMLLSLRDNGYCPRVAFLCMNAMNMPDFEGFEVAFLYESHGGTKSGYNLEHKIIITKLLRSSTVRAFSSTKLQHNCLESYSQDPEFKRLLKPWSIFKYSGVRRAGNTPMTCVYIKNSELFKTTTVTPIKRDQRVSALNSRVIQAANSMAHDSRNVWSVRLKDGGRESTMDIGTTSGHGSADKLRLTLGDFELVDCLTGSVFATGASVVGVNFTGKAIGFAYGQPRRGTTEFQQPAYLVVVSHVHVGASPSYKLVNQLEISNVNAPDMIVPISDTVLKGGSTFFTDGDGSKMTQRGSKRIEDMTSRKIAVAASPQQTPKGTRTTTPAPAPNLTSPEPASSPKLLAATAAAKLSQFEKKMSQLLESSEKANRTLAEKLDASKTKLAESRKQNKKNYQRTSRFNKKNQGSGGDPQSQGSRGDASDTNSSNDGPSARDGLKSVHDALAAVSTESGRQTTAITSALAATNKLLLKMQTEARPPESLPTVKTVEGTAFEAAFSLLKDHVEAESSKLRAIVLDRSKELRAEAKKRERDEENEKSSSSQKEFQQKILAEFVKFDNSSKLEKGLRKIKEQSKKNYEYQFKRERRGERLRSRSARY